MCVLAFAVACFAHLRLVVPHWFGVIHCWWNDDIYDLRETITWESEQETLHETWLPPRINVNNFSVTKMWAETMARASNMMYVTFVAATVNGNHLYEMPHRTWSSPFKLGASVIIDFSSAFSTSRVCVCVWTWWRAVLHNALGNVLQCVHTVQW